MAIMPPSISASRHRSRLWSPDFSLKRVNSEIWLFQKHQYICIFRYKILLTAKSTNVAYENNDKKMESIYSKRIRAGKRRTYFFDVRATRGNDYYLTITESRKRFDDNGYDRHKIFLYKEDFNKFIKALGESVDYVKTELMPDFDFDAFNHEEVDEYGDAPTNGETVSEVSESAPSSEPVSSPVAEASVDDKAQSNGHQEEVDKW